MTRPDLGLRPVSDKVWSGLKTDLVIVKMADLSTKEQNSIVLAFTTIVLASVGVANSSNISSKKKRRHLTRVKQFIRKKRAV